MCERDAVVLVSNSYTLTGVTIDKNKVLYYKGKTSQ